MPVNQQEKIRLFDYLTRFEKKIKNNRGHYDLNNHHLQTFINENDISFCSHKAKGIDTKEHDAYFQYEYKYEGMDKAHDLMRHIRNAIAHGNVIKKDEYFWLKDYTNKGTKTLDAKIKTNVFWNFLTELENTYH